MLIDFVLLIAGLVVLYYGAEFLVDGASQLAMRFGISPLIIGLTIVAFATSAPEFVVSLIATLQGSADMAVGNVMGSNIANIALIVGIASLILPMGVERIVFRRDYPFLVLITVIAFIFCVVGANISRIEGSILLLTLAGFVGFCLHAALEQARRFRATGAHKALADESHSPWIDGGKILIGIAGLVGGAQLMVMSASDIAREFGISELAIGVTIVAFGTSLPELATSVVAAMKKETDISLGNIVGSCIFNLGFILGGVSLIRPINVPHEAIVFDIPYTVGVTLLLFPLMFIGRRVGRMDGAILTLVYVTFITRTAIVTMGIL